MAQSVERRLGKAEVTGPIPVSSLLVERQNPVFMRVLAFFFEKNFGYTWLHFFRMKQPA